MNSENKINFESFTDRVAKRANVTNTEADAYLHELSKTVGDALEDGDEVKLYHFGRFHTTHFEERPGHNPRTGEASTIPEQTRVDFQPYKALLIAVNWPFRNLRTKMLPEEGTRTRTSTILWLLLALTLLALLVAGITLTSRMFNEETVAQTPAAAPAIVATEQPAAEVAPINTETTFVVETSMIPDTPVVDESPAVTTTGSDAPAGTPVASIAPVTIVVANGDTLWGIAVSEWGDSSWWPVLYSENRADMAARDPGLIEPGQSLRVPALEGSAAQPAQADLTAKARAYRTVADDYERMGHVQAIEYRQFVNGRFDD